MVGKAITKLRGLRHIMLVDPRRVTTPEQFNAHLGKVAEAVGKLAIPIEPPAAEPAPEAREEPSSDSNRMQTGRKRTRSKPAAEGSDS